MDAIIACATNGRNLDLSYEVGVKKVYLCHFPVTRFTLYHKLQIYVVQVQGMLMIEIPHIRGSYSTII